MSVILATAGYDNEICFWDAPSGICTKTIPHGGQVNKLEISPDKQFLAAAGHSEIRLYEIDATSGGSSTSNNNTSTSDPVLTLKGHTGAVTSLGFHRQCRYLYSGSEDGTIKLWDLRNPHYFKSFHAHGPVNSVCLRVDRDELISGDANGMVKLWDLTKDGEGGSSSDGNEKGSSSVTTNRQGKTITSRLSSNKSSSSSSSKSSPGLITQVQPAEGRVGGCLMQTPIQAVDISLHSQTLVAVSNHGTAYVWNPLKSPHDPFDHATKRTFRAHPSVGSYCLHARISPDCKSLCTTGSDGTAKLWDTSTWELRQNLQSPAPPQPSPQHPMSIRGGAYHHHDSHNTVDNNVSSQPTPWIWDAAFCDDSNYLVTASSDTTARIWKLEEGKVVKEYRGHKQGVTCVALNDSTLE